MEYMSQRQHKAVGSVEHSRLREYLMAHMIRQFKSHNKKRHSCIEVYFKEMGGGKSGVVKGKEIFGAM